MAVCEPSCKKDKGRHYTEISREYKTTIYSYSKLPKGGLWGTIYRITIGDIKGDTRSLDDIPIVPTSRLLQMQRIEPHEELKAGSC